MADQKQDVSALLSKTTITPDELIDSGVIPASRNSIYAECKNYLATGAGIECFRIGKKLVIPTAPLRRKLGLDAAA